MGQSTTDTDLNATIEKAMHETAPLYEGMTVLRDWLATRGGIVFGQTPRGNWVSQSFREASKGQYLEQFSSFTELLSYAFEYAEQTITERALADSQPAVSNE